MDTDYLTCTQKRKLVILFLTFLFVYLCLLGRLGYLMTVKNVYYENRATALHERERSIKAARGKILDRNGVVLADNRRVCTISVVHNQIRRPELVIQTLSKELGLSQEYVKKRVGKYSSMERIKSNVEKEIGDRIRALGLEGVKVDEDYKRYYPFGALGSKVIGFAGSDNQGILGVEVQYDEKLKGIPGAILTMTDAKGIELEREGERRQEPIAGKDLYLSLDANIQRYATQLAEQAMKTKEAEAVSIIVMNPQNGELLAMVNFPEYDLNHPFDPSQEGDFEGMDEAQRQAYLNKMWRNGCINDTYEPGSTFKVVTAAAALEEGVVTPESDFYCPGYICVDDRRIHCHKVNGHGAEDFVHATMNSCNPVFINVGLRLGVERYCYYFDKFGLRERTGIDLPGEAKTIMHSPDKMGNVELATVSFGQSFQITPLQLLTTVAMAVNGGKRVTPHVAVACVNPQDGTKEVFRYPEKEGILSDKTVNTMRMMLEKVVSEGGGKNGAVEGYRIGGKTATSQTLPRGSGKYIASFVGFAPANDPKVIAIAIINKPKGVYYGGQIAAPIIRQLFENILPYLGIMEYNQ